MSWHSAYASRLTRAQKPVGSQSDLPGARPAWFLKVDVPPTAAPKAPSSCKLKQRNGPCARDLVSFVPSQPWLVLACGSPFALLSSSQSGPARTTTQAQRDVILCLTQPARMHRTCQGSVSITRPRFFLILLSLGQCGLPHCSRG